MKAVYLDNAATTPMLPEVVAVINASMLANFGNPSSVHQFGRKAKAAVETARKNIAKRFNVSASEIIFTAGGTEADNLILYNAVLNLGVTRIITSKIEHHAVLRTVEYLQKKYQITVEFISVDKKGAINLTELEAILKQNTANTAEKSAEKTLVSLMYVNNEIGNLLGIDKVAELCTQNKAYFHSDTVQAIGHYELDLQKTPIDFIAASAHKFHGPKGVGFAYVKKGISIKPLLYGGEQERGARASTENVHGILGMEKALAISYESLFEDKKHIQSIKAYFIAQLNTNFENIEFNGASANLEKSSYTILNVRFPIQDKMMLFTLDLHGVAASGGSACQSGASKGSHVLRAFLNEEATQKTSVRFSFSKLTSLDDIDIVIEKLKKFKIS
ncbi:cysteine desulfurase [Tenacibaculum finnmarkense]|uniref:cysteine desulfurase family protein n=1 Tax=Tenacibaculum finnmarkense TaxID=2781243 RepID=UPI001E3CC8C9|nr:cysteine desulfurase family protein [Tenacibaculum finnmarkense]MCD8400798.1 cysteine desulfurase [Tenacibaculum finnmarkense genomovar ulcerans]MCD8433063.1 cysteine desulfurase [Tenacibaculum finnmarkense genomovar ulcerans]MCG8786123.1 cysteine desulfurase [Tenacibaculum finnmarkense]MCG8813357.1 cysteine desulfurase [Tenacibaculum finnmarkense]